MTVMHTNETVGNVLRDWRRRRRFSQLDLALETDVSTRHLSFVESGRSQPSRDMLLRLAERLELPLRERNRLLLAGGYAPIFAERDLDRPDMAAAMEAVRAVLRAYEPYPALAVDRHWRLVAANEGLPPLLQGVAPRLLEPGVDVLTLSLSPDGLAPFMLNYAEWRQRILERVRRDAARSGDEELARLYEMLRAPESRRPIGSAIPDLASGLDRGSLHPPTPFDERTTIVPVNDHGVRDGERRRARRADAGGFPSGRRSDARSAYGSPIAPGDIYLPPRRPQRELDGLHPADPFKVEKANEPKWSIRFRPF